MKELITVLLENPHLATPLEICSITIPVDVLMIIAGFSDYDSFLAIGKLNKATRELFNFMKIKESNNLLTEKFYLEKIFELPKKYIITPTDEVRMDFYKFNCLPKKVKKTESSVHKEDMPLSFQNPEQREEIKKILKEESVEKELIDEPECRTTKKHGKNSSPSKITKKRKISKVKTYVYKGKNGDVIVRGLKNFTFTEMIKVFGVVSQMEEKKMYSFFEEENKVKTLLENYIKTIPDPYFNEAQYQVRILSQKTDYVNQCREDIKECIENLNNGYATYQDPYNEKVKIMFKTSQKDIDKFKNLILYSDYLHKKEDTVELTQRESEIIAIASRFQNMLDSRSIESFVNHFFCLDLKDEIPDQYTKLLDKVKKEIKGNKSKKNNKVTKSNKTTNGKTKEIGGIRKNKDEISFVDKIKLYQ